MIVMDRAESLPPQELALAEVLAHRYGDGIVYCPRHRNRHLLTAAVAAGFVSEDGFVTRKGRALIARAGITNDLRG